MKRIYKIILPIISIISLAGCKAPYVSNPNKPQKSLEAKVETIELEKNQENKNEQNQPILSLTSFPKADYLLIKENQGTTKKVYDFNLNNNPNKNYFNLKSLSREEQTEAILDYLNLQKLKIFMPKLTFYENSQTKFALNLKLPTIKDIADKQQSSIEFEGLLKSIELKLSYKY